MKDQKGQHQYSFLFYGTSCYPISPFNNDEENLVDKDDQFVHVLKSYPNLTKSHDLSFLSSDDHVMYAS